MLTKEGSTKIVNFMTSGAGVLMPGLGHMSCSENALSFKNRLLNPQAQIRQTKYVVMLTKEESTKIVSFITPGSGVLVIGHGHISHIVKMHYSFKNLLLYSQALVRQSKYIVMLTKEESTKIVSFMTPGAGVLMQGHGHKNALLYLFI